MQTINMSQRSHNTDIMRSKSLGRLKEKLRQYLLHYLSKPGRSVSRIITITYAYNHTYTHKHTYTYMYTHTHTYRSSWIKFKNSELFFHLLLQGTFLFILKHTYFNCLKNKFNYILLINFSFSLKTNFHNNSEHKLKV